MARGTVWIVCELYYPDLTSTGWYVTQLAEALAPDFNVGVICAVSPGAPAHKPTPAEEFRRGVRIVRVGTRRLNPKLPLKFLGWLSSTIAIAFRAVRLIRRGHAVIVVTNPPTLPFAICPICILKRARCVLYVQDLYPDALIGAGMIGRASITARVLICISRFIYDHVEEIVVDGRDAQAIVEQRTKDRSKVRYIPYWADLDIVHVSPQREIAALDSQNLANRFVVQCSGNMGWLHDLDTVLDAATLLSQECAIPSSRVHFVLRGTGARRLGILDRLSKHPLDNVTVADPASWTELTTVLGACDVGLIALVPNSQGIAIPSRMYNFLAAGKPIVAVSDEDTELATMVQEECVGWIVKPGDPEALAHTITEVSRLGPELYAMGLRARRVAEEKYPPARAFKSFGQCLQRVQGRPQ